MENNRLHIRRFHVECLVSNDHPAPERVKARIDEAITKRLLTQTLSTVFSPLFSEVDPSVWLIRRLEIDIAVNAASKREQLTRSVTAQIARVLGATVQVGEDFENVRRFTNHADYLARFLSDLAQGMAWGKWYYESFAGLQPLPTSAALRTAICDQPDAGEKALLHLADDELKRVLRALTSQDARLILDRLSESGNEGDEFHCCQTAWAAWRIIEKDSYDFSDERREALHLYLAANREHVRAPSLGLKSASLALVRLGRKLRVDSIAQSQRLLSALTGGEMAALFKIAGAPDAEVLLPLLRCPPTWVCDVAQTLVARQTGQHNVAIETTPGCRHTSFGGAFLLLPFLDELPLVEATSDWPHADGAAAITLVRFLLFIKCCGQQRAERVFGDPLWRDLLLIPPAISAEVISDWQSVVTAMQVESFLVTLINWQKSLGSIRNEKQILIGSSLGRRSVVVLTDSARGLWLLAARYSPRRPQRLIEVFRNSLSQLVRDDGVLVCEPFLLPILWSEFPELKIVSLEDELDQTTSEEENHVAGIMARLDKLPEDLSYLALPDSFRLARALDLALSVAAQHVMRAFAWRLPGFAGSNLPYLARNFLDVAGSLEEEATRRVVRLGRPPLHLVLGVTGMTRQTYQLSWFDQRSLALFEDT